MCVFAWLLYVQKCNQEKLSLYNHCFLCCIETVKCQKKKHFEKKIYFCTKVILSLAYVLLLPIFPSVGCCIHCLCKCSLQSGKAVWLSERVQMSGFH